MWRAVSAMPARVNSRRANSRCSATTRASLSESRSTYMNGNADINATSTMPRQDNGDTGRTYEPIMAPTMPPTADTM